jgi:predicted transcriptional regulator
MNDRQRYFYEELGLKMRRFRLRHDVKQYEVAKEMGVSQGLLSEREKGRKPTSCFDRHIFIQTVKKLSKV